MGTFDIHSDVRELEQLRGHEGLIAYGLFTLLGSWTSANGRTGYVPDHVLFKEFEDLTAAADAIGRLEAAGLWKREGQGYRMLRGPHSDPDLPLPLWRYGDDDLGGRLFAIDDTPNT